MYTHVYWGNCRNTDTQMPTHAIKIKDERLCREPCPVVLPDTDKNRTASPDPLCVFIIAVFEVHTCLKPYMSESNLPSGHEACSTLSLCSENIKQNVIWEKMSHPSQVQESLLETGRATQPQLYTSQSSHLCCAHFLTDKPASAIHCTTHMVTTKTGLSHAGRGKWCRWKHALPYTQCKRGRQWAGTKESEMRCIWKVAAVPLS